MTEPSDHHDISEPAAIAELVLNADATDPTDPTLSADPTEPMLSTDPWEAMLNREPSDHRDHFESTIEHLRNQGTSSDRPHPHHCPRRDAIQRGHEIWTRTTATGGEPRGGQ